MNIDQNLGKLADPQYFTEPLEIKSNSDSKNLIEMLRMMTVIRSVEEAIGEWVDSGLAKTPCHLSIGQEAIPVGISQHLSARDRVFGAHRSHGHFLALNDDVYGLLAEVLGKKDGVSKGMGGSMHLYDQANGFYGSVPIVGATIPLAVGAGLAAKMDKSGDVAVCYFGDGTTEEGLFHECMNYAANFKIPVLFVCENNLYSSHLDIELRQPASRVARYADAHCVPALSVDGNDVIGVANAAEELIDRARNGGGPGFLEAVTYRWRGHVGSDANIDVGVRRKQEDVDAWKKRDPIGRLAQAAINRGIISTETFEELTQGVKTRVREEAQKAEKAEYPPQAQLMDIVYAKPATTIAEGA